MHVCVHQAPASCTGPHGHRAAGSVQEGRLEARQLAHVQHTARQRRQVAQEGQAVASHGLILAHHKHLRPASRGITGQHHGAGLREAAAAACGDAHHHLIDHACLLKPARAECMAKPMCHPRHGHMGHPRHGHATHVMAGCAWCVHNAMCAARHAHGRVDPLRTFSKYASMGGSSASAAARKSPTGMPAATLDATCRHATHASCTATPLRLTPRMHAWAAPGPAQETSHARAHAHPHARARAPARTRTDRLLH